MLPRLAIYSQTACPNIVSSACQSCGGVLNAAESVICRPQKFVYTLGGQDHKAAAAEASRAQAPLIEDTLSGSPIIATYSWLTPGVYLSTFACR